MTARRLSLDNPLAGLHIHAVIAFGFAAIVVTGCGEEPTAVPSGGTAAGGPGGDAGGSDVTGPGPGGAGSGMAGGPMGGGDEGGGGSVGGGGGTADIPGGGTVLFHEAFDNASFEARGWYDGSDGAITTTQHAPSSVASFACVWGPGDSGCQSGRPGRMKFAETPSVYLSMWLKFDAAWVGSGKAYHPHLFYFVTNADSDYVGPAITHLTTYVEVVQGEARLALQDGSNVDQSCILLNDDSFIGCNGDFDSYVFSENRSAAACNGIMGELGTRECFKYNSSSYYSARGYGSGMQAFGDGPPPFDKTSWHFVEAYFELNSIQNGVAVPDGKIRWVQDGQTLISSDAVLLRTAAHPNMAFDQFLVLPYIGDGSPVSQTMWVDELTVATARP